MIINVYGPDLVSDSLRDLKKMAKRQSRLKRNHSQTLFQEIAKSRVSEEFERRKEMEK